MGQDQGRAVALRPQAPPPPIAKLVQEKPVFQRVLSHLDIQSLYVAQQVCRDWAQAGSAASPTVLADCGLRPLQPPPPPARPDRPAPAVSPHSPLHNHVQCRRYLSHQPLLLSHHKKQDMPHRDLAEPSPPTLAVAVMQQSGAIVVFRDRRIDLYDLGQPGEFDYLSTDRAQRMGPTHTIQFHQVTTPLQRVVLSPTGCFAGVVDNHHRLHLYDIRRDLHKVACLSYPSQSQLAFCGNDTLLVAQNMDGTTVSVPLHRGDPKLLGEAEPLWPHKPVDNVVMASTSEAQRYLVVVDAVGDSRQARLFRRARMCTGPWECMALREDIAQAWLSGKGHDLMLQHADGSLHLEVVERSATRYHKKIDGTLLDLHPQTAMAVLYRPDRQQTVLVHITSGADPEPIDLCQLLGHRLDGSKLRAKFSASGTALMVQHEQQVWVIQNVHREPLVLRPAGGLYSNTPPVRFAQCPPGVDLELTQNGEYLAALNVKRTTPLRLFGLVPADGPCGAVIHLPRIPSADSQQPAAVLPPQPAPVQAPRPQQRPQSRLSFAMAQLGHYVRLCIDWILGLLSADGLRQPKKRFGPWPW
jgi:hypothetical protein